MTYAWSFHEDAEFKGPFDSRDDAIADARNEMDDDDTRTIWTGRVVDAKEYLSRISTSHIGRRLLDDLDEELCEDMGSEDRVLTNDSATAVCLGKAVLDWIETHVRMTAFTVEDIQEHAAEGGAT